MLSTEAGVSVMFPGSGQGTSALQYRVVQGAPSISSLRPRWAGEPAASAER